MTAQTTLPDCEAIRATFQQWQAEQEPLEAQLSESLAALSAYQSHLDGWQEQLAREREELRAAREQLDSDRSAAAEGEAQSPTDVAAEVELAAARENELKAALDEQKQSHEQERAQWAEELQQLRELLEGHTEGPASNQDDLAAAPASAQDAQWWQSENTDRAAEDPVLGSLVAQFGKLRQQRAQDRPVLKKSR